MPSWKYETVLNIFKDVIKLISVSVHDEDMENLT